MNPIITALLIVAVILGGGWWFVAQARKESKKLGKTDIDSIKDLKKFTRRNY